MNTNNTEPSSTSALANDWQVVSLDVLREKYAKGAEQALDGPAMVRAIRQRVARALAQAEQQPEAFTPQFLEALEAGFIPGGRINSAAGTDIRNATLTPVCVLRLPVGGY